jgi:hypothetical protein
LSKREREREREGGGEGGRKRIDKGGEGEIECVEVGRLALIELLKSQQKGWFVPWHLICGGWERKRREEKKRRLKVREKRKRERRRRRERGER